MVRKSDLKRVWKIVHMFGVGKGSIWIEKLEPGEPKLEILVAPPDIYVYGCFCHYYIDAVAIMSDFTSYGKMARTPLKLLISSFRKRDPMD